MNQIHVDRFAYTPFGTFGRFSYEGFECYTLEDPWKDNQRNVSCIPVGIYELKRDRYNRGGYDTFELQDVPQRSEILIHKGNTHHDVEGCLVLGAELGSLKNSWAVLSSSIAFNGFMNACEIMGDPERIVITNYVGGELPDGLLA